MNFIDWLLTWPPAVVTASGIVAVAAIFLGWWPLSIIAMIYLLMCATNVVYLRVQISLDKRKIARMRASQ